MKTPTTLLFFLQVLPGEVERLEMNQGTVRVAKIGEISDSHDSREMVLNNMGLIHVVKDEAQILPCCILNLTVEEAEINALLPDKMLQKVFSFLSPKDLKSSVLVCQRWAEVGFMPRQMSLKKFQCVKKLTPQQATVLFMFIKEENNCLRNVSLDFNKLSSVEPFILGQAMTLLRFLSLKDTGLTRQQVDAIFDALGKPGRLQGLTLSGNNLSFVDPTKIVRVNALQQIMMCFCKLTMAQVLSIVAGSLIRTKLKKVRWAAVELDGTSLQWQRLHELFFVATSLGIPIFQDTRCPCIDNMQSKHAFQYTCT